MQEVVGKLRRWLRQFRAMVEELMVIKTRKTILLHCRKSKHRIINNLRILKKLEERKVRDFKKADLDKGHELYTLMIL